MVPERESTRWEIVTGMRSKGAATRTEGKGKVVCIASIVSFGRGQASGFKDKYAR